MHKIAIEQLLSSGYNSITDASRCVCVVGGINTLPTQQTKSIILY